MRPSTRNNCWESSKACECWDSLATDSQPVSHCSVNYNQTLIISQPPAPCKGSVNLISNSMQGQRHFAQLQTREVKANKVR